MLSVNWPSPVTTLSDGAPSTEPVSVSLLQMTVVAFDESGNTGGDLLVT